MSVGTHDFIVNDISDDGLLDHIPSGTSHTFGLNLGVLAKHATPGGIHILAKAEAFLDRDKDKLDPDHYPVWFDFLVDVDGVVKNIDTHNRLQWYVYMDNKQNTLSCIEREVRQHLGMGWVYYDSDFFIAFNGYIGFYYIEIDDDTPVARGYNRMELDDGEASNSFEIEGKYRLNTQWSLYAKAREYRANTGFESLETNYEFLIDYKAKKDELLAEGVSLHLKIKYTKYNFERFNLHNVDMLPWDNDMLVQAYATIPWEL
jgi:hypothetical protein